MTAKGGPLDGKELNGPTHPIKMTGQTGFYTMIATPASFPNRELAWVPV